jgi:hypothetical protein
MTNFAQGRGHARSGEQLIVSAGQWVHEDSDFVGRLCVGATGERGECDAYEERGQDG